MNYYDILEVSPKASEEAIKGAYKALVRKYHPDLQSDGGVKTQERMKQINAAFEVLSNPVKRKGYDDELAYNNSTKTQTNQTSQASQTTANKPAGETEKTAEVKEEKSELEKLKEAKQEALSTIISAIILAIIAHFLSGAEFLKSIFDFMFEKIGDSDNIITKLLLLLVKYLPQIVSIFGGLMILTMIYGICQFVYYSVKCNNFRGKK